MNPADIETLIQLRKAAPITWRTCSTYYIIAAKYGYAMDNGERSGLLFSDSLRDNFIDQELSKLDS